MRILIIDDEKGMLDLLRSRFRRNNFAVDISESGENGLKMVNINEYDLIITDFLLPDVNGKEYCMKLRELNRHAPILIISAFFDISDKADLLNLGADDCISKPFTFDELLARARALLRRSRVATQMNINFGTLEVDVLRRDVKCCGTEIKLTRKEFMILEYLLLNKDKVVSAYDLIEHVWRSDVDPFTKAVKTHISNIRQKLKGCKNSVQISSVHGSGYKMVNNKK